MAFDFNKVVKLGNKPQPEANAGADALMQSMGVSGDTGIPNVAMNNTDKQDLSDVEDIMTMFGGGGAA